MNTKEWLEQPIEKRRTRDIARFYIDECLNYLAGNDPIVQLGNSQARSEARRVRRILVRRLRWMNMGKNGWTGAALAELTGLYVGTVYVLLKREEQWIDVQHPENFIVIYDEDGFDDA